MRFTINQEIRAPLGAVEAAFVDPGFYAALGDMDALAPPEILDQRVDPGDPEVVHLKIRYRFVGNLSPAVKVFLDPSKLVWIDHSTFRRAAHMIDFDMVAEHYPDRLRCQGTYRFVQDPADPDLTHQVLEGDVTVVWAVAAPLVERAIISGLTQHLVQEAALVASWAGRPASPVQA
ncbi:MAG: hypothetical protein ACRDX8_13705 [Acidimicrobiales bacterium]